MIEGSTSLLTMEKLRECEVALREIEQKPGLAETYVAQVQRDLAECDEDIKALRATLLELITMREAVALAFRQVAPSASSPKALSPLVSPPPFSPKHSSSSVKSPGIGSAPMSPTMPKRRSWELDLAQGQLQVNRPPESILDLDTLLDHSHQAHRVRMLDLSSSPGLDPSDFEAHLLGSLTSLGKLSLGPQVSFHWAAVFRHSPLRVLELGPGFSPAFLQLPLKRVVRLKLSEVVDNTFEVIDLIGQCPVLEELALDRCHADREDTASAPKHPLVVSGSVRKVEWRVTDDDDVDWMAQVAACLAFPNLLEFDVSLADVEFDVPEDDEGSGLRSLSVDSEGQSIHGGGKPSDPVSVEWLDMEIGLFLSRSAPSLRTLHIDTVTHVSWTLFYSLPDIERITIRDSLSSDSARLLITDDLLHRLTLHHPAYLLPLLPKLKHIELAYRDVDDAAVVSMLKSRLGTLQSVSLDVLGEACYPEALADLRTMRSKGLKVTLKDVDGMKIDEDDQGLNGSPAVMVEAEEGFD